MNINGTITLFPAKRTIKVEGVEKVVTDITTTLSSKNEDGSYLNKKINVRLVGKNFPEESVSKLSDGKCYKFEVYEGFLGVRSWKGTDGKERREVEYVITKGKLLEAKEVVKKEIVANDDLPF